MQVVLNLWLLLCSSRKGLAGMPLRRCLLPTTRWPPFLRTTRERWTCTLRPSPRLWGWTCLRSSRPGAGPYKQPLRRSSPCCLHGVTTPWSSMTELQAAAYSNCNKLGGGLWLGEHLHNWVFFSWRPKLLHSTSSGLDLFFLLRSIRLNCSALTL